MSVLVEAFSVVVPKAVLASKYPGGVEAYVRDVIARRTSETVARQSFHVPPHFGGEHVVDALPSQVVELDRTAQRGQQVPRFAPVLCVTRLERASLACRERGIVGEVVSDGIGERDGPACVLWDPFLLVQKRDEGSDRSQKIAPQLHQVRGSRGR